MKAHSGVGNIITQIAALYTNNMFPTLIIAVILNHPR